jgi:zinc transport system permease protein
LSEFLRAVAEFPMLRTALATAVLCSVSCGMIGSYVVVRRITYIAGGISHCVLGGLGAAWFLRARYGWEFLDPLYGAAAAALLSAAIIGIVSLRAKQREDTVISALWAVGMASGVLFISQTPGYAPDLMSYLFGSILFVGAEDVWVLLTLDAIVVSIGLAFYNQFLAICFDEEFSRLRGVRVELYYLLLLGLTALTVVILMKIVGIILVIALLTLPVAIAGYFCKTLWQMMALSVLLSVVFTTAGMAVSYAPGLPPGATTILLAGAVYLVVVVAAQLTHFRRAVIAKTWPKGSDR